MEINLVWIDFCGTHPQLSVTNKKHPQMWNHSKSELVGNWAELGPAQPQLVSLIKGSEPFWMVPVIDLPDVRNVSIFFWYLPYGNGMENSES